MEAGANYQDEAPAITDTKLYFIQSKKFLEEHHKQKFYQENHVRFSWSPEAQRTPTMIQIVNRLSVYMRIKLI